MNLPDTIRAVQKALGVDVDGNAGPATWTAIYNRVVPNTTQPVASAPAPPTSGKVDDRSEGVIATLLPEVQPYARALVTKAAANGITIKVISGLRTYAEQDDLYAQGRTKPGNIVTNARGGYSNHNFGIAFDIGVFEGSSYLDESPKYKAVGVLGTDLGLEWGGNWKTIQDEPHFQLRPTWAADESEKDMLAELRSRKDSGEGVYT
jgi:peptidoglycan LD-endopeptidase CwlK